MEALALRLSHLDTHVEGAIRVVMFYDTLMRRRVDLPALTRASAGLAACVAGIRLHGTGRVIRMSPDGRQASAPPQPVSTTAPIVLDEEEIGTVWLERAGTLRFTTARQPVVHHDSLGALALLAQVPQDAARGNADVAAIARMAGNPEDLETLDIYGQTGSLRRAADLLHLHHTSVARRLEQLGRSLGFELTEPTGLTRARLALTAWRLLDD